MVGRSPVSSREEALKVVGGLGGAFFQEVHKAYAWKEKFSLGNPFVIAPQWDVLSTSGYSVSLAILVESWDSRFIEFLFQFMFDQLISIYLSLSLFISLPPPPLFF